MKHDYTTIRFENENGIYLVRVNLTELPADAVIEQLIVPVLLAAGYSEETLKKLLWFE
jgi:hypothetical protein